MTPDPVRPGGAPLHRIWPRETLVGYACVACLAVVLGALVVFATSSYERVLERGRQQTRDAAAFFAEHGSRLFEAADLATNEATAVVEGESWDQIASSPKAWQALRRLSERFPYIDALYVVDQDGMTRVLSVDPPLSTIDVSDREYFRVHRDGWQGIYVSRRLVSRATERPGFALTRRISGPDGRFRGVAVCLIDVGYMAAFYRSVNLPYRPVISLFRQDFRLLAQHPPNIGGVGDQERLVGNTLLASTALQATATGATLSGEEDGRNLIVSYAKIANVPLYVSVAIERSVLLDVWVAETQVPGLMALVAALALGALAVLVFRQARRDERAKRILESEVAARTADLSAANAQLEVLVQEVHHRVKNNLQVISSLLRLQSIQVVDESMRTAFQDSVNRVHAMSLVHEMLSSADDRSGLEFRQYLSDLAGQLKESYGLGERVGVVIDCEDLTFDMTRGILLALIVNEVVSNALKHAFPDGRRGTLRLALARQGGMVRLTIEDDGVGLPADFDWRTAGSLGLQIVQSLSAKLAGEATLAAAGNTAFSLVFPLHAGGGRPPAATARDRLPLDAHAA